LLGHKKTGEVIEVGHKMYKVRVSMGPCYEQYYLFPREEEAAFAGMDGYIQVQEENQQEPAPQYRVEVKFWDDERTRIKSLEECLGDERNGKCIRWSYSGQKQSEEDFKDNRLHGKRTTWSDDGYKCCEEHYLYGRLHGRRRSWHYNGNLHWEMHYDDGLQHGYATAFDISGREVLTEHYVHGAIDYSIRR